MKMMPIQSPRTLHLGPQRGASTPLEERDVSYLGTPPPAQGGNERKRLSVADLTYRQGSSKVVAATRSSKTQKQPGFGRSQDKTSTRGLHL